MKTNIKRVMAVVIITIFIAGNAFAGAKCGSSEQRDKGSKAKNAIMRELNLTAEQQKSLEQGRTAQREAMEALGRWSLYWPR